MSPKRKETKLDKAARLEAESLRIRAKAEFEVACQALKAYPVELCAVARSLKQEGIITPDGGEVVLNVVSAPVVGAKTTAEAIEDDDEYTVADQQDIDAAKALHRNFQKWGQVPALYLRKALSFAEPVSLAFHSLKALIPRGSREVPRAVALEIMELMTDLDPAMDIGDARSEGDIINIIVSKNRACGRRARELRLIRGDGIGGGERVFDTEQGIYSVRREDGKVIVAMLGADRTVTLDVAPLEDNEFIAVIQQNHSRRRAILEYEYNGNKGFYELALLFARAGVVCAPDAAEPQHATAFVWGRAAAAGPPFPTSNDSSSRPRRALSTSQTLLAAALTETPLATKNPKRLKSMDFADALEDALSAGLGDVRSVCGAAKPPLDESFFEPLRDDEEAGQRAANNAAKGGGAIDVRQPCQATPAARMKGRGGRSRRGRSRRGRRVDGMAEVVGMGGGGGTNMSRAEVGELRGW